MFFSFSLLLLLLYSCNFGSRSRAKENKEAGGGKKETEETILFSEGIKENEKVGRKAF